MKPHPFDLAYLHQTVRRMKPYTVLEFGSGFSTLFMADALERNGQGKIVSVESNQRWLDNTAAKIPAALLPRVDLRLGIPETQIIKGQLAAVYRELPNVHPDLIYLDGPDPLDVQGTQHGLGFTIDGGANRTIISADCLYYESSMSPGSRIIVDGRYNNVCFLQANLVRSWSLEHDSVMKQSVFTLRDHLRR